jgi:hypothetical protein
VCFATLGVAPVGVGVDAQVVDGADVGGGEVDPPVGLGQTGQVGTELVGDDDPVAEVDRAVVPVGRALDARVVRRVFVAPVLVGVGRAVVVGQVPPDPVGVGLPVGVADVVGVAEVGREVELDGEVAVVGTVVVGTVVVGNVVVGNLVLAAAVVDDFAVVVGFAVPVAVVDVVDEAGFGLEIGTSGTLFSGRPCW